MAIPKNHLHTRNDEKNQKKNLKKCRRGWDSNPRVHCTLDQQSNALTTRPPRRWSLLRHIRSVNATYERRDHFPQKVACFKVNFTAEINFNAKSPFIRLVFTLLTLSNNFLFDIQNTLAFLFAPLLASKGIVCFTTVKMTFLSIFCSITLTNCWWKVIITF